MNDTNTADALAEVPVHAAVLRATADLPDLLSGFFTDVDPATRVDLGAYLINRYGEEATASPSAEASATLQGLSEAGDLLRALACDYKPAAPF